jgi:hypothetical protein
MTSTFSLLSLSASSTECRTLAKLQEDYLRVKLTFAQMTIDASLTSSVYRPTILETYLLKDR